MQDTFDARRRMGPIELWEKIYRRPAQLFPAAHLSPESITRHATAQTGGVVELPSRIRSILVQIYSDIVHSSRVRAKSLYSQTHLYQSL